jgi:proline utilization trans-activator
MNRRNTARCWIGLAFHLSLTLGLHHNVSDTIPIDPVTRQHRIRIWWTMYTCDRMWGAKTGYPVSIQDEDISVDYPSLAGLNDLQAEEFSPSTAYVTASIRLARIAGSIVSKIYSRRKQGPSFVQSVQQILNDLKVWVASLPESLKLDEKGIGSGRPRNIISLHLAFNQASRPSSTKTTHILTVVQCVILSTRPVLLYVFKQSSRIPGAYIGSSNAKVSPITAALGEACLHTARHSNSILTQCWIEGSLTLFGYLDAQYLFSSAIVLAISSMFGATTQIQDIHGFETAAHILLSMSKSGNLAARDFSEHLEQVKKEMDRYHTRGMNTSEEDEMNMSMSSRDLAHEAMDSQIRTLPQIFTTEMALLEQPMQDFLAQPLMSGVFPNPLESFNDMPLLYSGPLDWVVSQGISQ